MISDQIDFRADRRIQLSYIMSDIKEFAKMQDNVILAKFYFVFENISFS